MVHPPVDKVQICSDSIDAWRDGETAKQQTATARKKILLTVPVDREKTSIVDHILKLIYEIEEEDCLDWTRCLLDMNYDVMLGDWHDFRADDSEKPTFGDKCPVGEFSALWDARRQRFATEDEVPDLSSFALIMPYKMQGFLENAKRFRTMIMRFKESGAVVVNDPGTILHNIDKRYMFDLAARGIRIIPTLLGDQPDDVARLKRQLKEGIKTFVAKPRLGERGKHQHLLKSVEDFENFVGGKNRTERYMFQDFMSCIRDGERSMVFVGGQFHHAVLKKPNPDDPSEYRCNESQGGKCFDYQPTPCELNYAERIHRYMEEMGYPVHSGRIDVIVDPDDGEPILMEAELLNPSFYANITKRGPLFAAFMAKYLNRLLCE